MKHWICLITVFLMTVTLSGCGGGGGGNHQTVSAGAGAIEGYVWVPEKTLTLASTRADTQAASPIVTPMVTLGSSNLPPLGYIALVGADITVEINGQVVKTKTDSTGHFKVDNLPAGIATVTITPPLIGDTGLGEFFAFTTTMEVRDKTTAYIGNDGQISLISISADYLSMIINQIDGINSPSIDLYVSVIDPVRDTPIIGLSEQNFEVSLDDSTLTVTNVQQVESFSAPASICLVLDRSGSMEGQPLADLQSAAKQFVEYLAPNDRAEIISFSYDPTVDCLFTSNKDQLNSAIDQLVSGGATALFDAVGRGIDDTLREPNNRKAVVVMTDGGDNNSYNYTLDRVIDEAKSAGVPIYTVGLAGYDFTTGSVRLAAKKSNEQPTRPAKATTKAQIASSESDLQLLARETGGEYFYAPSSSDLMGVYTKISQRQQQMYVLTITDPAPQNSERNFKVTVNACGLTGNASASYRYRDPACKPDNDLSWDPLLGLQMYTYCTGRPVYQEDNYFADDQCTWFVYAVRPPDQVAQIRPSGENHAYLWWDNYQNDGFHVGQQPKVGSIAVWNENVGGYGHVALVTNVYADNTFDVWDNNYRKDGRVRHRLITTTNPFNFSGFIYWKGSDEEPLW